MQASAACPNCSGRFPVAHIDDIRPICRRMRAWKLFRSRNRLPDITAAAADRRLGRTSFASTALAETWTAPAHAFYRKDAPPRRKAQQPQQQHQQPIRSRAQHTPINSSSSRQPHSPVSNPQDATAAKYGPNYTLNRTNSKPHDSQASSSSQQAEPSEPNQLLSSAIDKLYKQRLREVKALVSSGMLEELQQDLTPEQQQSLQLVLQDLQDMQGSWEEEEEQLNPAEQQLVDQLSNTQIMPDDFGSYLMAMLPEGSGPAELQQLMHSLDPAVLQDIQSVYDDLKEFEQAQLDLPEAQQRYVELSSRIASVTTRVQSTLTAKMQQQPQQQLPQQQQPRQQQWQQPRQRQRQRAPLLYSAIAAMSVPAEEQQQQQREPLRFSTIAFGNSSSTRQQQQQQSQPQPQTASPSPQPSSSSSSRSTSGSGWGSSWAQTRPARHSGPLVASQSKGALFGQQQQQEQQQQQQQQVRVSQPAQLNATQQQQGMGRDVRQAGQTRQQQQREVSQATVVMDAAALNIPNGDIRQQQQQQQQQQPPVRQRRRRVVIRREPSPTEQ